MTLQWAVIDRLAVAADTAGIASVLLTATEQERAGFAAAVEAGVKAAPRNRGWEATFNAGSGYALAIVGTQPSVAKATVLLGRRDIRDAWSRLPVKLFLEVARARDLPWISELGARLAAKLPPRETWSADWEFVAALLAEGDALPPVTEGVARGWFAGLLFGSVNPITLADAMRRDPYLDLLLPALFAIDGLGLDLAAEDEFAPAVARLAGEGRLDRKTVLDATIGRLVRGDRPAALRPFTLLHDELAPEVDELAVYTAEYERLVSEGPGPVAALAQRALLAIDGAGLLELDVLVEVGRAVVVRKEKFLVKAQLVWLDRRAGDAPAQVAPAIAEAFGHPSLDVQERALTAIAKLVPQLDADTRARIAGPAALLGGDLAGRAAALFGELFGEPEPVDGGLTPPPPAAEMPPPIGSPAELAEEIVALAGDDDAVRWERVLAGLVALRHRDDLAPAFEPVLGRYGPGGSLRGLGDFLGAALHAAITPGRLVDPAAGFGYWPQIHNGYQQGMLQVAAAAKAAEAPDNVLAVRIAELAENAVPLLVATPSHVNGSLDAAVLLERLRLAAADRWAPLPADFAQALLRVPRTPEPAVAGAARALGTAAGLRLADWLDGGGLPDPVSCRFEQTGGWFAPRAIASVEALPGPDVGELGVLFTLAPPRKPARWNQDVIRRPGAAVMALPHHREVIAAWQLPRIAELAAEDFRGGAEILPLLAEANGPIGPAFTLCLTYGLGARAEPDRVAALDAFLILAARSEPFAAAVGAELGTLCADGSVKLNRVVLGLADAHRAGADHAVWELLVSALPALLGAAPRGMPDLLELATQVASAIGARAAVPALGEVAGRTGSSRFIKEAKRLHLVISG